VVSFVPQLIYLLGKSPITHWIGGWVPEPVWTSVTEKIPPCWETHPGHPASSLVTILIELHSKIIRNNKIPV
jgi:hypothetical protein